MINSKCYYYYYKYLTFCSLYGITRMYIDVLEKCATFSDLASKLPSSHTNAYSILWPTRVQCDRL